MSSVVRLTYNDAVDHAPDWSPDGQCIAFASDRDGYDYIYVMDADGSSVTRLTNGALPRLWTSEEVSVKDIHDYFSGVHTVTVLKEGYDDTFFIPGCDPSLVVGAIADAVAQGLMWMANGPASILGELVPPGVLSPSAKLRRPPAPITVDELMPSSIPDAWSADKMNTLAIATALSSLRGITLPWSSVQTVIESAIQTRWLEVSKDGSEWPTDLAVSPTSSYR